MPAATPPADPPAPEGPAHNRGFFGDPDVLPVGAAAGFFERGVMTPPGSPATEAEEGPTPLPDLHLPVGIGQTYNPRQRASLDEGPLGGSGPPTAAATRSAGGPAGSPAMAGAVAPALAAPRVGTSTPEIFRPKPQTVAPIAGTGMVGTAVRPTLAARWMNDPTGRHQYRYWDGANWTENVYDAGVESRDPVAD